MLYTTTIMTEAYAGDKSVKPLLAAESTQIILLPTDESLTSNLGHLNPEEIIALDIKIQHKARIAQLQIEALRSVRDNGQEMLGWLACYYSTMLPVDGV